MKRNLHTLILILMLAFSAAAEGKEKQTRVIPVLSYDHVSLEHQAVNSPGAALILTSGDMKPASAEETDNLLGVLLYKAHIFNDDLLMNLPDTYHTVDFFINGKKKRSQYLLIFKSDSNEPFTGGFRTFQAGAAYGYEVKRTETLSLVLGGGLAVGEFGVETGDGDSLPVIPLPLIRLGYDSDVFALNFDFLTNPNFDFTIAPKSRIRFNGEIRMDQFRDERDLVFDFALNYRLLPQNHPSGDFAGVSVGIMNDSRNFDFSSGKEKTLDVSYYALYGKIDLSFVQLKGGYAFSGREMYREKDKDDVEREIGDGFFVSAGLMYQF